MSDLKIHPVAELFPEMGQAEFGALVADIREHGQRDAIVVHDGSILDGRHRYKACRLIGIQPRTVDWDGKGTVEAFVVSKNLHRRHLNESQRAMIATQLATLKRGDAKSQRRDAEISALSQTEAATLLNVSRDLVTDARRVLDEGTAEEIEAARSGVAAVSSIAREIRKKTPVVERKKKRAEPLSQSGKNPERIQNMQIRAETWGHVKEALIHLTNLPLPADVVPMVRAQDRTGLIDARLAVAVKWILEFEDEWKKQRGAAAA